MTGYVLFWIGLCLVIIAALFWAADKPKAPEVKSRDAIDEEIRAERITLHNSSLDYAELQTTNRFDVVRLAGAFRAGALWQQHRDDVTPPG